ncbi:5-amino-6-(5-phospho-D-ribitylamino)uracil phosphatase [Lentibacillus sp. JNUCC-1]|uniref:HAD family hydrolase n=1 Tax=Lentibacillus sp. JNUCC-1 TaxID=2654513 RepID=UPI0012E8C196|nr:HAD family hydrolase [Lentibacillus sp. JNUCC-1]MUV38978.1 5-amino-6-(5-phospho-D-ribitylamino)uracil phosphatase [Lentibacillus sp. JNUCC-1]
MTYQIVFLDIDGTILKPDHTYTPETKAAIAEVKAKGLHVFLATGRPIHEIAGLAEELDVDAFIGYNGAYAVYEGETLVNEPIESNKMTQILETAEAFDDELIMYTNGANYFTDPAHPSAQNFIDTFQLKHNAKWDPSRINDVLGATLMRTENPLHYEQQDPSLRLAPVTVNGISDSYDILRKEVNKGQAINKILKELDIPKEAAIAFGDGMNDKEMLQSVGAGFAMGNAHPELFQYCTHRTATVTDSGIRHGLQMLKVIE